MLSGIRDFIKHGIWSKAEQEYDSPLARWAVRHFKVLIYSFNGFGNHRLDQTSAALTFYTMMSIVPIIALIFGIVKGFGGETSLEQYLYSEFASSREVVEQILNFADNLLARTKGGVLASVSFVVLVWAVVRLFGNAESAFNTIWEVRRSRSLARKLSDYLSVVFVAPILLLISNTMVIYVKTRLSALSMPWLLETLYGTTSLATMWIMFAFIYTVMPNTRVKLRSAFPAGVIAGTMFQLFQIGYVWLQTWMTSYNAIYGSFAALPLFLIWLQTSWQIVLAGAELTFAYQNIRRYEQERESLHMSYDHRQKVMVATMMITIRNFLDNSEGVTSELIAEKLGLPLRIVRDVIFDLEGAGLLSSVHHAADEKVNYYIPARDVHAIRVCDVIDSVETRGQQQFDLQINPPLQRIGELLDKMRADNARAAENALLMDIRV
jgi:membrane protein